jgi:hypothetical protein
MGAGAAQAAAAGGPTQGQQQPGGGGGSTTDGMGGAGSAPLGSQPSADQGTTVLPGPSEQQQQQPGASVGVGLRRNQSFGGGRAASLSVVAGAAGAGADASRAAVGDSSRPGLDGLSNQPTGAAEGAGGGGAAAVQQGGSGTTTLVGPVAGIQVAIWTRLRALQPLLPIVYADRDPSPRNLRTQLVSTLLQLLALPAVQPAGTDATSLFSSAGSEQQVSTGGGAAEQQASAAAAAACTSAGVTLFDRLLDVFTAMLSGKWERRQWCAAQGLGAESSGLQGQQAHGRLYASAIHSVFAKGCMWQCTAGYAVPAFITSPVVLTPTLWI